MIPDSSFFRALIFALISAITLTACEQATETTAGEPEEVLWDEMIPLKEGVEDSLIDVLASTDEENWEKLDFQQPVKELNGKFVRVPGFVVPLESDEAGLLSEFLLVPYFGACIHSPAPPPNQVVYVKLAEPVLFESIYDPYWVIGTMTTTAYTSEMADSVYQIAAVKIEDYTDELE